MSYTPTNWATGDVITAEKLNNMESGISAASGSGGGGLFIIKMTSVWPSAEQHFTPTLNKTRSEILEAINNGQTPIILAFQYEDYGDDEGETTYNNNKVLTLSRVITDQSDDSLVGCNFSGENHELDDNTGENTIEYVDIHIAPSGVYGTRYVGSY